MKDKDQTTKRWMIIAIIIMAATVFAVAVADAYRIEVVRDTVYVERTSNWDRMIEALCLVESNGRCDSVNTETGATGVLQLLPVYVEECNRLCGSERFSLDDRLDFEKSIEMFLIYQRHYNPERDIDKAIRLHNPKAGEWYKERVKSKMGMI